MGHKIDIDELFTDLDRMAEEQKRETSIVEEFKIKQEEVISRLSAPQKRIVKSQYKINLFLAGQGSGKTHNAGVKSAEFIFLKPHIVGLVAANTYSQLTRSTLKGIRKVWKEEYKLKEYKKGDDPVMTYTVNKQPPASYKRFHEFDHYHNIVHFWNGAVIYIGSMDNYKALDGMEIGYAFLDETKDTKEEAVKEVILGRLRQDKEGINPLYITTSPAKVPWLNDWFDIEDHEAEIKQKIYFPPSYFHKVVGEKKNNLICISSTYLNKKNLPADFIENMKANIPKALRNMLIYGDPLSKAGGEYYKSFDRAKHVKRFVPYNPTLPLHISFDENVNPYFTLVIWQLEGKTAKQVDEICLENPLNTLSASTAEFKKRYKTHNAGLFIYGDATSKKQDTKLEKGQNFFTLAMRYLKDFKPKLRVPSVNPPVVGRGDWLDLILENEYQGISILIAEKCKKSIGDFTYLKEASDGTKDKKKVKNPQTGVTYEPYGHTSDATEYLLCMAFVKEFTTYLKGGSTFTGQNKERYKPKAY